MICVAGGKIHKEIFTLERAPKGSKFYQREWELLVKPIIEKWGRFVEEFV